MVTKTAFDPGIVKSILDKMGRDNRYAKVTLPTLSFEELYQRLDPQEARVIQALLELQPGELGFLGPFVTMAGAPDDLVPIKGQYFTRDGVQKTIPDQYVPQPVWAAFRKMQAALRRDTGSKLMVESGYRSPAHQAITFLTYLEMFNFDILAVAQGVALPGYSQHGDPLNTAVDMINQAGIPTDEQPQLFAQTHEYEWLLKNAEKFSFDLSYPPDNPYGVIFEPWHWRYRPRSNT